MNKVRTDSLGTELFTSRSQGCMSHIYIYIYSASRVQYPVSALGLFSSARPKSVSRARPGTDRVRAERKRGGKKRATERKEKKCQTVAIIQILRASVLRDVRPSKRR